VNVVADIPCSAQGETTEKPTPMPKATITKVTAADAALPARIAPQLTAEWESSKFVVIVAM